MNTTLILYALYATSIIVGFVVAVLLFFGSWD